MRNVVFFIIGCLLVWSCSEHVSDIASITLPENLKTIPAKGGSYQLQIETNGGWSLSSSVEWMILPVWQGKNHEIINVTITENTGAERSGILTLASGSAVGKLEIVQDAATGDVTIMPGRLEIPRLTGDTATYKFIEHTVTYQGKTVANYSMEYNLALRHTRWVAFTAYDLTAADHVTRTDAWGDDPQVPADKRTERADYSGYDRGHLVASNDRRYCREANEQTFYYSNMSPQLSNFNQKIWQKLEENVKAWMQDETLRDTLYVVKGGTIREDQVLKYNGVHGVPVPKYYFMAVLAKKGGKYKSIAFWLEHKNYSEPYDLQGKALSVDELEEKTGIDFFPALSDAIEQQTEASYAPGDWTWKNR